MAKGSQPNYQYVSRERRREQDSARGLAVFFKVFLIHTWLCYTISRAFI